MNPLPFPYVYFSLSKMLYALFNFTLHLCNPKKLQHKMSVDCTLDEFTVRVQFSMRHRPDYNT